jgi:hypothetical protein
MALIAALGLSGAHARNIHGGGQHRGGNDGATTRRLSMPIASSAVEESGPDQMTASSASSASAPW